jgi:probable rRNA maturation factor
VLPRSSIARALNEFPAPASEPKGQLTLKSAPGITVRNLQRGVKIDLAALRRFALRALDRCLALPKRKSPLSRLACVDVFLISDRRIAGLHRRFHKITGPTDVLTFQHGEIFISVQTAQRHATEFGTSTRREIELYLLHGLLHLHGFDDKTAADRRKIEAIQRKILRTL